MSTRVDVLVVGAGFAGLAALAQLRDEGFAVLAVERGSDVGGAWYWNRYPGLRCDIESMHYSYSWDDQLQQEWTWTERFPSQPELLRYAQHVADRFDLRPSIRFDTAVTAMRFNAEHATWSIELSTGDSVESSWVVMATGALSTPKAVDIRGTDSFAGMTLHTANWPDSPVDVSGKRVAVIGTGSSGIQVATELAKDAGELVVLQRTPSYTIPAGNRALTPAEIEAWKRDYSQIREDARHSLDGLSLPQTGKLVSEVSAVERQETFDELYAAGVPFAFFGVYKDILFDDDANATVHNYLADRIRDRVDNAHTVETLTPHGYPFGTRRPCIDSGYYEIFNQDNVRLVDVLATPIQTITPQGIETSEEHIDVDVIVYATGYDAFTGTLTAIDIRGTGTGTLADAWSAGARSYLGLMVAGFPNMFIVTGPQSPSVLSNMIVSIEQHVEWIRDALVDARACGFARMEAEHQAEQDWVDHAQELAEMMQHRKATSWYVGANVAGKPRVVLPYLGGVGPFRARCSEVARHGYVGFARS